MVRFLRNFILLTILLLQIPLQALQVTGLYQQRVAVANESESERNRAFSEALRAVILKITGDPQWLDHPTVTAALRSAQDYVEAIGYYSELVPSPPAAVENPPSPVDVPGSDDLLPDEPPRPAMVEQRYLDVTFAASLVNQMLAASDIPVWDANRPSVLLWMVLENAAGERSLMTAESNPEILQQVQTLARQRALPVIFPVLDFEDRRNLSVEQLWALDEDAIAAASQRYGADSILSGRLHITANGELLGLWQFQFRDQVDVFDGFATELNAYLQSPMERITTQLARTFAIVPEFSSSAVVQLRVEGIGDLADYAALMNYVRGLSLVQSVVIAELDGERLDLKLGLQGSSQQLNQLIALDRDLLPIESSRNSQPDLLHYRWTR